MPLVALIVAILALILSIASLALALVYQAEAQEERDLLSEELGAAVAALQEGRSELKANAVLAEAMRERLNLLENPTAPEPKASEPRTPERARNFDRHRQGGGGF